ncbi:hypothetical protein [Streptomyces sp. NPDC051452]
MSESGEFELPLLFRELGNHLGEEAIRVHPRRLHGWGLDEES